MGIVKSPLGLCRGDLTLSGVTPESGVSAGYGDTGVVMSIGVPNTLSFSMTKSDIRGAGILSVGANTMPTVDMLINHMIMIEGLRLTIADAHLVDTLFVNDLTQERAQNVQQFSIGSWQLVHKHVEHFDLDFLINI